MITVAAILYCKGCKHQIAWIEKGSTPAGFKIKAGMKLHTNECPKCNSKIKEIEIIEMKEKYNRSKK